MRTDKWYQRRLAQYFDATYYEYEDSIEFFPDPRP